MNREHAPEAPSCGTCGATVTGRYCASCGSKHFGSAGSHQWLKVMGEYAGTERPLSVAHAIHKVLRAPVRTPVDLALDPAFTSHFYFFGMALTLGAFVYYVGLPNAFAYMLGKAPVASNQAVALEATLHYVLLLVYMPLTYLVFSPVSSSRRTPMQYLKLWLTTSAFNFLFQVAMMVVVPVALVAGGLAAALLGLSYQWIPAAWYFLQALVWLAIPGYSGLVAARFWEIPPLWSIAVMLMLNVLDAEYVRPLTTGLIVLLKQHVPL